MPSCVAFTPLCLACDRSIHLKTGNIIFWSEGFWGPPRLVVSNCSLNNPFENQLKEVALPRHFGWKALVVKHLPSTCFHSRVRQIVNLLKYILPACYIETIAAIEHKYRTSEKYAFSLIFTFNYRISITCLPLILYHTINKFRSLYRSGNRTRGIKCLD